MASNKVERLAVLEPSCPPLVVSYPALYDRVDWSSAAVVLLCAVLFMAVAAMGYDPGRGFIARRGAE